VSFYKLFNKPSYFGDHKTLKQKKGWHDNYFKFTFTRNPWDRFLSCYCYFKAFGRRQGPDIHSGRIINKFKNFKDFVISFDTVKKKLRAPHFKPQVHWLDERLDFIGKLENLEDDFHSVCDKIGIPRRNLPHANKSKHTHYTEYYDDETREIIAQKYWQDIEYCGYRFGE
tara:strand:- start:500 stop:1009 length:510 start_codon:yes stop_codon:yes gene_type:complete